MRGEGREGAASWGIESERRNEPPLTLPRACALGPAMGHVPSKIRSLFSVKQRVVIVTPADMNC